MGYRDVRVCVYFDTARIQVQQEQISKFIDDYEKILNVLQYYFSDILLDLKGR